MMLQCNLCSQLENILTKDFILRCKVCGHIYSKYDRCYCDHDKECEIKIGIIEKCSFEDSPHMIIKVGEERIWLEGPLEAFCDKKECYSVGSWIEMMVKGFGTIVGECDFGDINVIPLFVAEKVRLLI